MPFLLFKHIIYGISEINVPIGTIFIEKDKPTTIKVPSGTKLTKYFAPKIIIFRAGRI
jgi:hypothetical protein